MAIPKTLAAEKTKIPLSSIKIKLEKNQKKFKEIVCVSETFLRILNFSVIEIRKFR